jgi:hypothetical protein
MMVRLFGAVALTTFSIRHIVLSPSSSLAALRDTDVDYVS